MTDYKHFIIKDLCNRNGRFTFILEAPYKDEINNKTPASGSSGIVMSRTLLNKSTPFGKLISKKCPSVNDYSVMNASCIPIETLCYLGYDELQKEIEYIALNRLHRTGSITKDKAIIKNIFVNHEIGRRITSHFHQRLKRHIQLSSCQNFIICGVTAQVIFEIATGQIGYFHKSFTCNLDNQLVRVFYENHPSNRSGGGVSKWYTKNHLQKLFSFLEK